MIRKNLSELRAKWTSNSSETPFYGTQLLKETDNTKTIEQFSFDFILHHHGKKKKEKKKEKKKVGEGEETNVVGEPNVVGDEEED